MTEEQKCIKELYLLLDKVAENAKKRDLSLIRPSGISGCDMYQGMPPICRAIDNIFEKYQDLITDSCRGEQDE